MADEAEKKAFYELKERMQGDMDSDLYEDDNVFYRFLKARDLKVNHAEAMLREHLKWREKYDVKNIFKYKVPEVLKMYLPMHFLGFTKEGHVLRYMPSGNIDTRGVLESSTEEEIMKHQIKVYEEDSVELKKQSKKIGKLVDKVVYIHNAKGLTLSKITDRKVIFQLIQSLKMHLDNYPETLKYLYVVNAPAIFGILHSILKPIIPSKVVKKIKIFTDDSFKRDLLEIADAEILPAFLGGKKTDPDGNPLCNTFINHGEVVPHKYYIINKKPFVNLPDVRKKTVPGAEILEMRLEVQELGSDLEWEFQLESGDIQFGILYENENGEKTEIVPLQWITDEDGCDSGSYKCKNVGIYIIVLDNSNGALPKDVFYKTQIKPS